MEFTSNDICLILTYGQSNSVGVAFQFLYPGVSVAPSAFNVTKIEPNGSGSFVVAKSMQYQRSINEPDFAEDRIAPICMLGDLMSQHIGQQTEVLLISAGVNGAAMEGIYKNTPAYNNMIDAVSFAHSYAQQKGKILKCPYVGFIHGESDAVLQSSLYAENVRDLYGYMLTDIKGITGQTEDFLLVVPQIGWSYWADLGGSYPDRTMFMANDQIRALSFNSGIRIATPGYILPLDGQEFYRQNFQASHYSGDGYAQLAWYMHKCYTAPSWTSFTCTNAVLSGNEITLDLAPITGGIQVDLTRICKDGRYGFEFKDLGDPLIHIVNIIVLNSVQLKIVLSSVPTASTKMVYYAYSMHYTYNWLQSFRQNGAVKDADNNYLLAFSKTL